MSYLLARSPSLQADAAIAAFKLNEGERNPFSISPPRSKITTRSQTRRQRQPSPLSQELTIPKDSREDKQKQGIYGEVRVPQGTPVNTNSLPSSMSSSTVGKNNKSTLKRTRLSNGVTDLRGKKARACKSKTTIGGQHKVECWMRMDLETITEEKTSGRRTSQRLRTQASRGEGHSARSIRD